MWSSALRGSMPWSGSSWWVWMTVAQMTPSSSPWFTPRGCLRFQRRSSSGSSAQCGLTSVTAGEMMLPILEADFAGARSYGRDLAFAVHLTNMIRDVAEDLDRGRVYIPREDLDRFGADPRKRLVTREWRELMRFEIERARGYYSSAEIGISHLSSRSAACLRAGADLYSRILDRLEANGFDVFNGRVVVPLATKLAVAGRHAVLIGRSG